MHLTPMVKFHGAHGTTRGTRGVHGTCGIRVARGFLIALAGLLIGLVGNNSDRLKVGN